MFEWITGDYMLKTLDYSLFQNGWLDEIDPIDSVSAKIPIGSRSKNPFNAVLTY